MNWKKDEINISDMSSDYYDDLYEKRIIYNQQHNDFVSCVLKEVNPQALVLDIGCGTGNLSRKLNKYYTVIVLDISSKMLHHTQLPSIQADGELLPFKTSSFDVVICSHTLHHYPNLHQIVNEVYRVLKPGGKFIIQEPNRRFIGANPIINQAMCLFTGFIRRVGFHTINHTGLKERFTEHHRNLTIQDLEEPLKSNGFKYHCSRRYFISPYFVQFTNKHLCNVVLSIDRLLYYLLPNGRYIRLICEGCKKKKI